MNQFNSDLYSESLGVVIGGSVSKGLEIKLNREVPIEKISVGSYVVIEGHENNIIGMITDVKLDSLGPGLLMSQPDNEFTRDILQGTAYFGIVEATPMLLLNPTTEAYQPSKGIPKHFASVRLADKTDLAIVFGEEDESHLPIGKPLEMENLDVVIDLKSTVERSSGVFGKSGTGKTFLVRQLLAGFIKGNVAANLVFDMHDEYGWTGRDHERNREVKGLKQLSSGQVVVLTLDQESSDRRKVPTDGVIRIGYSEVLPEDIEILSETLNLTEAGKQLPYRLHQKYGSNWLKIFLNLGSDEIKDLVAELNENESTVQALRRRLDVFKRFDFLSEDRGNRSVQSILDYIDQGFSVVLEFGKYGRQELAYILVANLLTRRIFNTYVERTERSSAQSQTMRPLVITIEESHKFLSPSLSNHTIFGVIAREGRKYGVTLLVVDQRPSGIDDEVISQIGTKLVCYLDNDKDVEAVLSGVPARSQLRTVLTKLHSVQQALLMGHALPMPIVVETKEYGTAESYLRLGQSNEIPSEDSRDNKIDDLFD